jgi:hypothetical protein
MSQFVDGPVKTFLAAAALAPGLRVYITDASTSPPTVNLAGAANVGIGTVERRCHAAGDQVSVRLTNAQGTRKMVAADVVTAGNPAYAAASGKIAAAGTLIEGRALESSTANNDVIEVLGVNNTDLSTSIAQTNAAAFEVDADAATPKIALAGQAAGTGDYTTTIKPETTLTGDNAIICPEADGDTLAAVALAQTLTNKTLGGLTKLSQTVTPVAAAGTTVADAAELPSTIFSHITSDGATKGVKLPTTAAQQWGILINNSATAAEFYAAAGGTVNGLSANASVVIPASKGLLWVATGANTIIAFDLPAKATAS